MEEEMKGELKEGMAGERRQERKGPAGTPTGFC